MDIIPFVAYCSTITEDPPVEVTSRSEPPERDEQTQQICDLLHQGYSQRQAAKMLGHSKDLVRRIYKDFVLDELRQIDWRMLVRASKNPVLTAARLDHVIEADPGRNGLSKAAFAERETGVSRRTYQRARTLVRSGCQELVERCEAGEIALTRAADIAALPVDEQAVHLGAIPKVEAGFDIDSLVPDSPIHPDDPALVGKARAEAAKIRRDFLEKLAMVVDKGIFTLATLQQTFDCKDQVAIRFIHMAEIAPQVDIVRTFGRKNLAQYSFRSTGCDDATDKVRRLVNDIADLSLASDASVHQIAKDILFLLGD